MKKLYLLLCFMVVLFSANAQQVFLQGWYWDYPKTANGFSWADTLRLKAANLKTAGFTHIWFPPHTVASFGTNSNGYDPKDLFIGNQTTGLGTRTALDNMLAEFTAQGIAPVADMVFNHRDGGAAEVNPAVKAYITNYYNASKEPFPSDRFRCILPLGGTSGNGAGDYYFKFSSKTGDSRFNNYTYKLYMQTNTVGYQGPPDLNEVEPNGGGDCGQGNNDIFLGKNMFVTLETGGGCNTDEFHLHLNTGDFNPSGDTIFIYMNNTGGYSDHRIYGIYSSSRGTDIVNDMQYQTYTNFNSMASGRGFMNYDFFKPNDANASTTYLNGDWDGMYFFYDYDQFQKKTADTLINWAKWNWDELGVRGMRLDAVKHFTPEFVGNLLDSMHKYGKDPSLLVGEWYSTNPSELSGWINSVQASMEPATKAAISPKIFDFTLREQLRQACDVGSFDSRNIFNNSLHDAASLSGFNIVTFVNNHDFRDASGFASLIRNNPNLAYAYILTNNQLGVPTVFYPDYYGYPPPSGGLYGYHPTNLPPYKPEIDRLIQALKLYINGSPSVDYLNRFSTPYSSNFIQGSSDKALIYQLQGFVGNGNHDVIVAINFGSTTLKVDHEINTRGGAILTGTKFTDVLGRSAYPYQVVSGSNQVYIELPAYSYSVWVQGDLPVLPLSMLSFNGKLLNGSVELEWNVSNESGTVKYEIERSANQTDFVKIGELMAANKGEAICKYSYSDKNLPKDGYLFYRLKIIENSGAYTYSKVIKIKCTNFVFDVNIWPNPVVDGKIQVAIETARPGDLQVAIYSSNGQLMYMGKQKKIRIGTEMYTLPVKLLSGGNYFLKVNDGEREVRKNFVVN
ncbi:MAG: T9SS type A sorting domain-containing protein [Bacteroidetes bacterium]|nr:T9SS type A sorting domain-containing protein [Bacteroidota bacterium]MCB0710268.1 T9SS type A sorting domain-containing protein [Chitinophagaceae bacterium]